MKKIISLALLLTLVLALCACGASGKVVASVNDLPGAIIGVQQGTTGATLAESYENPEEGVEASKVERYSKGADAVQALVQGKIDCVIIDEQPAKAFVAENPGLKILSDPFAVEEYAIAIAKSNTDLLAKINQALGELKADGTLDKIAANFMGGDTQGTFKYTSTLTEYPNGTLTMGTNAAFPPYEYYENEKIAGYDVDMATAIADKLGMKLDIEDMEFDSIIAAVTSGKIDVGIAGMSVTEDRLLEVNFSESYTTSTQVIIVKE